ncbi:hypothetical protein EPA93_02250 [Ktedonosporobacter rubrisoli]|uniref:Uncharacterized protein n=1 Tax=Ktedonosporobacter rubrisoli TaxID=2509675 RepID=A0A4P6JIH8_KTERU|nr:hypothetical protein [Ktedonosporobacter rubrisoli]QBD74877.1 hypothetical protein EPA93_02250 [Ktedonosporobacter rubrisoli]
MWPGSYTSLKIVHDQKIKEALEYASAFTESEKQKPSLFQIIGAILARFSIRGAQKPGVNAEPKEGKDSCDAVGMSSSRSC